MHNLPGSLTEGRPTALDPTNRNDLALVVDEWLSPAEQDRIIGDPLFSRAARQVVQGWSPDPKAPPVLSNALRDMGQTLSAVWAMQLDAAPEGLTHSSLANLLALHGFASPGRVRAMLLYLRFKRLIEAPEPGADARHRRYRPTPALRRLLDDRLLQELRCCAILYPQVDQIIARWDQPAVRDAFRVANGQFTLGGFRHIPQGERSALDVFWHRNSGMMVLGELLLAADQGGDFPPGGPVRLAVADVARRTGASRNQVRAVLKAGIAGGYLIREADERLRCTEDLLYQLRLFIFGHWAGYGWCTEQVLRTVSG